MFVPFRIEINTLIPINPPSRSSEMAAKLVILIHTIRPKILQRILDQLTRTDTAGPPIFR